MKNAKVIQTQFRTEPATLKALDKYAAKMGLSRNQLMNNLVAIGLDDLKVMDRMGLIKVGVGIRTVMEQIREPDQRPLFSE